MNTYIYLSLSVIAEYVPYKCIHCTWMYAYVCVCLCAHVDMYITDLVTWQILITFYLKVCLRLGFWRTPDAIQLENFQS